MKFLPILTIVGLSFLFPMPGRAQDKPAVAAPAPAAAPLPRAGNYKLSPNDVIVIRIFREPDLDKQCRISQDGTISFPLLNIVNVAGKTTNEAGAYIAELLDKDYIVKPQVSVEVVAYQKQRYNIMGQVNAPGGYAIPDEQTLDLLSAIATAGGFTRLADQSKVIVRRPADGKEETFTFDARTFKDRSVKPFLIQPNDTIVVKERFF